ncbi:hypothetical protein AOA59_00335, partial [Pseudomonas sp. 2822-15]|uniref:hypothetical protein n=1 Tax=Pseudomonas sp. 2822-15 TaxID=1712677 RepID=UPI000C5B7B03
KIKEITDEANRAKNDQPKSLEECAALFSDVCDDMIFKGIRQEGLTFVSGMFTFKLLSIEEGFTPIITLYFQKKNGEWVKKTVQYEN